MDGPRFIGVVLVSAVLAGTTGTASAVTTLGPGFKPGLAVDAAGTAYVVWNVPGSPRTALRFCRLPRGATQCDPTAAASIAAPGTFPSRPFVVVSGSRVVVVQHRTGPLDVPGTAALYAFTSMDGGRSFPTARVIGSVAMNEAIPGPGDTISGVDWAGYSGTSFQSSPLDGSAPVDADGSSTVGHTVLSSDSNHSYGGTVGLADASTPVAVFTTPQGVGEFRRYGGKGSVNDAANWTPARDLGFVSKPTTLAGGPSGLFLLGSTSLGGADLFVRKWDGSTFGPRASLGISGNPTTQHFFEDAAGRLHAVFVHAGTSALILVHAVSDNGSVWRMGTVATMPLSVAGEGFNDTRVATAPDHIGIVAWKAGSPGEIRVAPVGPDEPALPVAGAPAGKPQSAGKLVAKEGTYKLTGIPSCVRNGQTLHVTLSFKRANKSGNPVLKVRRTDFFLQGQRASKDTSAPFRVTIPVLSAKPGTTYTLRARVYLKVRRGAAPTRSLSRSVKVC